MIGRFRKLLTGVKATQPEETGVVDAYDLWSEDYDIQPGNLMLQLDENLFSSFLNRIDLKNKTIADVGCGTGRHWPEILKKNPSGILGFDISPGMLSQLRNKFPDARVFQVRDNLLLPLTDASVDCLISTLTIAHIEDAEEALNSWARVIRPGGDLYMSDFHPAILAMGGKRSFRHHGKNLSVTNFIHPLENLTRSLERMGFRLINKQEKIIQEDLKSFYQAQNALNVYKKYLGTPVIYSIHLKKNAAD